MNKVAVAAIAVGMIIGTLALVIFIVAMRSPPERREPPQMAMLVDVTGVTISEANFRVGTQGTVRPRTETQIMAEVSGQLVRVSDSFVAGGFFRAGEVLAEIDPSDYEAALLHAEAELASARSVLADERARSEQARRDWQRLHGSEQEPNELVLRLPQLQGARAGVQAREAAVLRARRDLERTRITLPYDGLVRERAADLGQYVSAGTTLGRAFGVAEAEVRLPLTSRDLQFLDLPRPGYQPASPPRVWLHGMVGGRAGQWEAEIVRTEGVVEEASRLTHAVARIQDPYGLLEGHQPLPLPMGTFVSAQIDGRSAAGLIALPRVALRDGDMVYIADNDDRLVVRPVEVVRSTPDTVYVANALQEGDRVITTAIQTPLPGLALRVREIETNSQTPDEEPVLRVLPLEELASGTEEDPS